MEYEGSVEECDRSFSSCNFFFRFYWIAAFVYVSHTIKGNQTSKTQFDGNTQSVCDGNTQSLNPYLCAFDSMKCGEQIVVFMNEIISFVLSIMKLSILNNFRKRTFALELITDSFLHMKRIQFNPVEHHWQSIQFDFSKLHNMIFLFQFSFGHYFFFFGWSTWFISMNFFLNKLTF